MIANFLFAIFFKTPDWILRTITLQKPKQYLGQRLDLKSQLLIGIVEKYLPDLDDYESFRKARNDTILNFSSDSTQSVDYEDKKIDVNQKNLEIRDYVPADIQTNKIMLYFHGGGYVIGSIDSHHGWVKYLSSALSMRIISLNYRLAPENPFPSALEDANDTFEWIKSELNVSDSDIIVCGDSAGGHLAASLSTYRMINSLPMPEIQFLIYPMIDPECNSDSQKAFSDGLLLNSLDVSKFWALFQNLSEDNQNPCFNLTLHTNKSPHPKTLLITAGFDPLTDEGEVYAKRLNEEGTKITQLHYPNLFHAFVNFTKIPACKLASDDLILEMKAFL